MPLTSQIGEANIRILQEAYRCWKNGTYQSRALYQIVVNRHWPADQPITLAGFSHFNDYVSKYAWPDNDIFFLGSMKNEAQHPLFDEGFLNYLQRFTFSCEIDAQEEGAVVYTAMPVAKIEGPLIQTLLLGPVLLQCIQTYSTPGNWPKIIFEQITDNR
ncbi:MAG: hypothetical protein IPN33_20370 [Saprospiraceae bacterium]|nr:hypothetical protein [Saprospiraceae bacterium]